MPNYDTGAIRNLLTEVFPDADEIEFFADDYFKEVKFEPDMALKKRAHVLTQYCAQNDQLDKLLAFLQKNHPAKYAENSAKLFLEETPTAQANQLTSPPLTSETQSPTTRATEPVASTPSVPVASPVPTNGAAEPAAEPQGQDVFISYSTKNLDFVKQLYQYLTSRGLSVWFDKESLEGGDQWRESIVKGIMGCKVFLLVLSPNSVASINVRKEVDLAEHHKKKILPLMWQDVPDLPPSFQYQLAGTQYVSFHGETSEDNFNKAVTVVNKLLGGAAIADAAAGEQVIKAPGITDKPAQTPQASSGRPPRQRPSTGQEVSAIATGIGVMTKVVNRIKGFTDIQQDENNEELKWLFNAAEHFLKVRRGEIERTTPLSVKTPPKPFDYYKIENAVIQSNLDDFSFQMIESQVQGIIKQINIYMRNLAFELDKEAQLGGQAASNIALMNSINAQQKAILDRTQELAQLMEQVFGIIVYAPDNMIEKIQ